MKEQLQQRLDQLKDEFTKGQQMLIDAEQQVKNLQDSLLRINGAIQVLEEELLKLEENESSH
jgi:uncharacterized protein (DUF3084 family)